MADQNFKELLDEQKKTNQLLIQSMKDPDLGSSIKQNLGEILNASRLAGRSEKYQKKEGVTEVDEKVEEVVEAVADLHDDTVESFNSLQKTIQGGTKPASEEEEDEDKQRNFTKQLFGGLGNEFSKGFKGLKGDFKKLLGAGGSPFGGGLMKKLLAFGGLAGALLLLKEDDLLKAAEVLDKTVLPFLKIVGKKVGGIVGPRLKKLMDDTITAADDPEKGIGFVLKENKGTIGGAIALYYSRTIAAYALAIGAAAVPPVAKFVSRLTSMAYFGTSGKPKKGSKVKRSFGTRLAGLGRVVGAFALLSAIYDGVMFSFEEGIKRTAKKEEDKTLADLRRDNSIIPDPMVFIAGAVGGLYKGLQFLSGKITGLLFGKDAEKQVMEEYNKSDAKDSLLFFFDNMFSEIKRYLGILLKSVLGIFAPKNLADMEKDLFKMQEELTKTEEGLAKKVKFYTKGGKKEEELSSGSQQVLQLMKDKIEEDKAIIKKQKEEMIMRFPESEKKIMSLGLTQEQIDRLDVKEKYHGGGLRQGSLALIGEGPGGRGGELVYSGSDAMVMNQSRTDQMLSMALEKGLSGGGNNAPTIITTDNSVRSNTSNMISSPSMITSNDSLMNSITNSV